MPQFPGALYDAPTLGALMSSAPTHSTVHNNANDEIEAIESTLGTNPQGAFATVKAWLEALPKGQLPGGYAQNITGQGPITALTDLTSLSVTVTVAASRRIKITGKVYVHATAVVLASELVIREGSTTLNGDRIVHETASQDQGLQATWVGTPTAGAHTYKLSLAATATSVNMTASATSPAFILVEDIGAA